jgi:hypothetical protein
VGPATLEEFFGQIGQSAAWVAQGCAAAARALVDLTAILK